MGAVFANAPIEPAAVAVQIAKIHFDARCKILSGGKARKTVCRETCSGCIDTGDPRGGKTLLNYLARRAGRY
jgi:hypothetical protein